MLVPGRNFRGYGGRPPAVHWPNGAYVAVNIVVNYEEGSEYSFWQGDKRNETLGEVSYDYPRGVRDLAMESMYEYGSRAGIWRVLGLFEEYKIHATVFGCAQAFEVNREVAEGCRAGGHDLLSHGWRWSEHWTMSREEEARDMERAIASFEETWGSRPIGWYCRYGPSVNTRDLLLEEGGFLYDSDAYNDDLPYFVEVRGRRHLVIPYSLTTNDVQGDRAPGTLWDFSKRALDELWREGERGSGKMMSVGLHPRFAGQPSRANAVREFIEYALGKGRVWFARRSEIAQWWLEQYSDKAADGMLAR